MDQMISSFKLSKWIIVFSFLMNPGEVFANAKLIPRVVGKIEALQGQVTLSRGLAQIKAKNSDSIQAGDRIHVNEGANLSLSLDRVGTIRLIGKSSFIVPKVQLDKHFYVKLMVGSLWCKVQKAMGFERFEIQTPTATAGVRGTEFEVVYDEKSKLTRTLVDTGQVMSRDLRGRFAMLKTGMMSLIGQGRFERHRFERKQVLELKLRYLKLFSNSNPQLKLEINKLNQELQKIEQNQEKSGQLKGMIRDDQDLRKSTVPLIQQQGMRQFDRFMKDQAGTGNLSAKEHKWNQILDQKNNLRKDTLKPNQKLIETNRRFKQLEKFREHEMHKVRQLEDDQAKYSQWYREKLNDFRSKQSKKSNRLPRLKAKDSADESGVEQSSNRAKPRAMKSDVDSK